MSGQKAVKTGAKKRIPSWGVRGGMQIGCKVTLRGKTAMDFLDKSLEANDRSLKAKNFDNKGNFAFGVKEYIDIPGLKYDPDIGILGFDVCVTLNKWGYRVGRRKRKQSRVPDKHVITKEEAIAFTKEKLNVQVAE